jgi:AraC-like DNA-binding protein
MSIQIIETDFDKAKKWPGALCLGDDLLLLDRLSDAPFPKEARRMSFILIGLCTKGSVSYRMDMKEQLLTPGHIVIASDRHVIDQYEASPDLEGLCMFVSVPFYNEIIRNVGDVSTLFLFSYHHPIFEFSEREQQVFKEYFYALRSKIGDTDNRFRRDLIQTLMLAMFYDLSNVIYRFRHITEARQTRANVIFTQFIKLIEENCREERHVSWYAHQLGITPKYLSEIVKHISRRTPNEWIDNYVMLEIRVLLRDTSLSIKEISKEMHFPNQSFLGKYFKEHAGISPSEYRKS